MANKYLKTKVVTEITPNGHVLVIEDKTLTRCKYPIASIAPFDEWMN